MSEQRVIEILADLVASITGTCPVNDELWESCPFELCPFEDDENEPRFNSESLKKCWIAWALEQAEKENSACRIGQRR